MVRLLVYFGFGALAHWLWIGSHVDPADVFTYVCFLLGLPMCIIWVFAKAFWVGIGLFLLSAIIVPVWFTMDWVKKRRRKSRFPFVPNPMGRQ